MTEIADLLARLESAAEGSRELDGAIFRLLGLTDAQEEHCRNWCRMDGRTDLTRERYIDAWALSYTTSLDAALTLVPDGYVLYQLTVWPGDGAMVEVWGTHKEYGHGSNPSLFYHSRAKDPRGAGKAPTAALAVCIAALKANAALADAWKAEMAKMRADRDNSASKLV